MLDKTNTDTSNPQTETPDNLLKDAPDLRYIYRCWELAVARADDPRICEDETKEAVLVISDCEEMACKIVAMTLEELAIKAVIACGAEERGACAPDLAISLVLDARRILAIPERDREIADYFDIWTAMHNFLDHAEFESDIDDQAYGIIQEIDNKVARFPASTAEGLARKVVMAVDLGSRNRDIVESTRFDIERLAGYPMSD